MNRENNPDNFFLAALKKALKKPFGHLETKHYKPIELESNLEANELPFEQFLQKVATLGVIPLSDKIQIACVGKPITLSNRDINFFIESEEKRIRYFHDLNKKEFKDIFSWHIELAQQVSRKLMEQVHLIHGFNPEDSAAGTHSISQRMHIHLFMQQEPNFHGTIHDFDWFARLSAIEPFAKIVQDYVSTLFADEPLISKMKHANNDNIIFEMSINELHTSGLDFLFEVLHDLHDLYYEIEKLFTEREEEGLTGFKRYVPYNTAKRMQCVTTFISSNPWLSADSQNLLLSVAHYLQPAGPRRAPDKISTSNQVWLAKGFAGAISFIVDEKTQQVRISVAPRILTTSAATKLFHSEIPVWIQKSQGDANETEQKELSDFENLVMNILRDVRF